MPAPKRRSIARAMRQGSDLRGRRSDAARRADARDEQAPAAGRAVADDLLPAPAPAARRACARCCSSPASGTPGDFIDLLGDGRLPARGGDEPLLDLDLTYKVQIEAGGIAQVVGMARDFARGEPLVVCLGDNIFEYAQADAIRSWAAATTARWSSSRRCPTPRTSASSSTTGTGAWPTSSRRPASWTSATTRRRTNDAVVGLYCYHADVFEIIEGLKPSSRGELEITDVNRAYAERGALAVRRVERLVARRRQALQDLAEIGALDRGHRREQVERERRRGHPAASASRTSAAGSWSCARESRLPKATGQTNVSFSRKGMIRGLHYHERGQDDLFVVPAGDGARRRARPRDRRDVHARTSATTTPWPCTSPADTRTASRRSPTCSSSTTSPRSTTRPTPTSTAIAVGRSARRAPLEHAIADPLAAGRRRVVVTGAGGQLGRALSEAFAADERRRAEPRGAGT